MSARRAVVSGRVQGVGFRFFAERAAKKAGVFGWVRNLPDGRVETVVEGSDDAVERYLSEIRKGPFGSRVTDVAVEDRQPGNFDSFEVTR
jgi:acylphosphatase